MNDKFKKGDEVIYFREPNRTFFVKDIREIKPGFFILETEEGFVANVLLFSKKLEVVSK